MAQTEGAKYIRPKEIYQRIRCMRCTHRIWERTGKKHTARLAAWDG